MAVKWYVPQNFGDGALRVFLGGSFYSVEMLPPFWQMVTLFNPVVYLISGFRWSFYGISDVDVGVSLGMTVVFLTICLALVCWIFKTGYDSKRSLCRVGYRGLSRSGDDYRISNLRRSDCRSTAEDCVPRRSSPKTPAGSRR